MPLPRKGGDDTVGFVPEDSYLSLDAWMTANAAKHAGTDAQPQTKKEKGYNITALGVDYNITDMDNATVALCGVGREIGTIEATVGGLLATFCRQWTRSRASRRHRRTRPS